MGSIQKAFNILGGTLSSGAIALAKGLEKPKQPGTEPGGEVGSSLSYTTELSSDEAAMKAFAAANDLMAQKSRAERLRDAKTGRFVRLYKKEEGGNK